MSYEDLEVWKRSVALSIKIYKMTEGCKDFGFRDQVRRSGLSVPSNIAEGYERESNKDIIRFLVIARGSLGELKTQLIIGRETGLIEENQTAFLYDEAKQISAMLQSLINSRRKFD